MHSWIYLFFCRCECIHQDVLRGCVIWLTLTCGMNPLCVWHDSCMCAMVHRVRSRCLAFVIFDAHMLHHGRHMNESCHTHPWVTPHIWKSHITHMIQSYHPITQPCLLRMTSDLRALHHGRHMNQSYHTHKRATHMNTSCRTHQGGCHTHEWVMSHQPYNVDRSCFAHVTSDSHTWMRHVTHVNGSCHTHKWVMSHTWMSHTDEWVMSSTRDNWQTQTWMSSFTDMDVSVHTYRLVMSHCWVPSNTHTLHRSVKKTIVHAPLHVCI